jgi:hypothetical protein
VGGETSKEQTMTMPYPPRTTGELFGELSQDLLLLMRQEVQLAKTEVQAKVSRAIADLVSLAAGGFVALIGALALAAAIVLALIDPIGLDPWLAALLVGGILAIGGYTLLRGGLRDLRTMDPALHRAVHGIKQDIQMLKERRQ